MWAVPGLVLLLMVSAKLSTAQDSRLDHVYPESENSGLEVMQENPCPKGCLPEKRARSIGAGGPLLDVLSRRSALDKNFVRFGRTPPDTTSTRDENVYRASRAKNTNFIRLGRGKADNFMRFGKGDPTRFGKPEPYMRFGKSEPYMRFGKAEPFMRFGRRDDFIRFGRSGKVVRLGQANGNHSRDDYRYADEDFTDEDLSEDGAIGTQVQESDEDERRWKRNAMH